MKCKKCGKEISNLEVYCDDCKEVLKQDILKDLIEENNKLNELEKTMEIDSTEVLSELENKIDEENKEVNVNLDNTIATMDTSFVEDVNSNNKNKKILIISIVSVFVVLLIAVILFLLLGNKSEPKEEVEKVDYEKIINEYGMKLEESVNDYIKENDSIPTFDEIAINLNYDKHDIECLVSEVYKDGKVYLDECRVDHKKVDYKYGKFQEKEGLTIDIYKEDNMFNADKKGNHISSITCDTMDCTFIEAYEKYAIINEEEKIKVFDFYTNKKVLETTDNEYKPLSHDNNLYGLFYIENDVKTLYSFSNKKTFTEITGELFTSIESSVIHKYNYAIFKEGTVNNFYSLKTGKISYTIEGEITSYKEDNNKKIVYMTVQNKTTNKIKVYSSTGKLLFDGKEFNEIIYSDDKIYVYDDNNLYTYNDNLVLENTSTKYNKILFENEKHLVVIKDNKLMLVDFKDNVIKDTPFNLNDGEYEYKSELTKYGVANDLLAFEITIEDKLDNKKYKYSYQTSTGEIKKEEI